MCNIVILYLVRTKVLREMVFFFVERSEMIYYQPLELNKCRLSVRLKHWHRGEMKN